MYRTRLTQLGLVLGAARVPGGARAGGGRDAQVHAAAGAAHRARLGGAAARAVQLDHQRRAAGPALAGVARVVGRVEGGGARRHRRARGGRGEAQAWRARAGAAQAAGQQEHQEQVGTRAGLA